MKVEDRKYVSIEYRLSLDSGEVADESDPGAPLGFIMGSGEVITGLQKGLMGMEVGQSAKVVVSPDEGYGQPNPHLIREIPRENFPDDLQIQVGMGFEAKGPHGVVLFKVAEVRDDVILADFNHPMAGQTLHFEVKVADVRDPTEEEWEALSPASGCGCGGETSNCSSDCGSCGCEC